MPIHTGSFFFPKRRKPLSRNPAHFLHWDTLLCAHWNRLNDSRLHIPVNKRSTNLQKPTRLLNANGEWLCLIHSNLVMLNRPYVGLKSPRPINRPAFAITSCRSLRPMYSGNITIN